MIEGTIQRWVGNSFLVVFIHILLVLAQYPEGHDEGKPGDDLDDHEVFYVIHDNKNDIY